MNIGILARGLDEPIGGVKQYIYDISRALLKIDNKNTYFVFYNDPRYKGTCPGAVEVATPVSNKFMYDHIVFPRVMRNSL